MDWNAGRYHAISDPQLEWGRRVMQRLAPKPGERILDLGCGTARLTTILLEKMGQGHACSFRAITTTPIIETNKRNDVISNGMR